MKELVEKCIMHYGIYGKMIKHLCDNLGIVNSSTTHYHPEGDGITMRCN